MPNNADKVVIGQSGALYFAPVGTAGPVDLTTALAAAWTDSGFLSEDGVTLDPSVEFNEVAAWQSRYPIRRYEASRSFDISFAMMEMGKANFILSMGGGAMATTGVSPNQVHTYTPPTAGTVDERAFVVEWVDGTKKYRLHAPKGLVTDFAEINVSRTDPAMLDVTVSVLSTDGVASFTILSNDAAWI